METLEKEKKYDEVFNERREKNIVQIQLVCIQMYIRIIIYMFRILDP